MVGVAEDRIEADRGGTGVMWRQRRVLLASLIGTAVEFYDFYIYATAASLVFGMLFFPADSDSARTMLSFASFALAFIARPLGASIFGHFGDRVGRKSTLVASLMLMGGSTVAIGFLPTYQMAGLIAPILLCLFRLGQGFGLGGEWGGAALLAVENAPPGWRARFGMMPQLGAPVGFIAANGLFLILGATLSEADFLSWGWRLPFIASSVLVLLGLWVRLKLTETAEFAAALEEGPPPGVPIVELFRHHGAATLTATMAVVTCFALFYITTAFTLTHATQVLHLPRESLLGVQLIAILFLALGIVHAGWWADRTSPRTVLIAGCIGTVPLGIAFGPALATGSLIAILIALSVALYLMGLAYGPLGAWLTDRFPTRVRYTGASMAFNVGGIIGGGAAPIVAQGLATTYGTASVGLFLTVTALFSLIGLWLSPKG
ncbi:MHS family MFS transporter [Sphingobium sufflavum]|uniref:MFS transporter n=1 Tax=Sphingobium sufflavum TaxID=1129547 RepID=UPI001F44D41F|nr:MFS transporter [Sphingobium sufflavum]MCE7798367.1 MHS family MFS transporter [Sphingobium sufflavum]